MQSHDIISSECISSVIHRLSLGIGDFEGFLYGTKHIINSSKLKDDGSYEKLSVTTVHNIYIFNAQKIIQGSAQIQESLRECPKGMKVVGWISGRREVPAMLSVGDRSTYIYLLGLHQKFPEIISQELILGLFVSKHLLNENAQDIEIGKSTMTSPFEFKFFNPSDNYSSIKIEIDNLKVTQSNYNDINFTYSLEGSHTEDLCNKVM